MGITSVDKLVHKEKVPHMPYKNQIQLLALKEFYIHVLQIGVNPLWM